MRRPFACLLLALAVACATPGPAGRPAPVELPGWVDDPFSHPRCERPTHLAGVGSARGRGPEARQLSKQRALDEIVGSIVVAVQATIELDSRTRRENEEVFWAEEIVESVRISMQEDLPGAEVLERWTDPGTDTLYTLASVRRDLLLDAYLPTVFQAIEQAQEHLDLAGELESTVPDRALRNTLQAYQVLADAYESASKARVVASESRFAAQSRLAFEGTSSLLAGVSARLARLAGGIQIRKLGGDGQHGFVRGGLDELLRARLEYQPPGGEAVPLRRFPVSFTARQPGAATLTQSSSTTDDQGEVACMVSDLAPTGLASNEILVQPGFAMLAPTMARHRVPTESFTYRLPTPGQTTILLVLQETFEGRALATPFLARQLADHLSSYGFDVRGTPPAGTSAERLATAQAGELLALLGDRFGYVIRGGADARSRGRQQGINFFTAQAHLQIIEVRSGHVQSISTDEVKDGYLNESEAGAVRVLRSLERELLHKIDVTFVAGFVPALARED